jgi:ATP-binding cassette subfamily C (CFTR/MRP) protein 1
MSLPFDEARYNKVVNACGLREDFANWDNGDLTMTGARGSALSGGQRQRVALARAVYTDADIYLLDDVLSAIDARLERHIFQALFGSGGLLAGKTVVMVGHNGKLTWIMLPLSLPLDSQQPIRC